MAILSMRVKNIEHTFFLLLIGGTSITFTWLVRDFMQPVFWAVLLALLFQPIYRRWLKVSGNRRSLASLLSVLVVILAVIIPLFLVGLAVVQEFMTLYQRIASKEIDFQEPIQFIERYLPIAGDYLEKFGLELQEIKQGLSNAAMVVSQFIGTHLVNVGQNAVRFLALCFIMLYLLYFFFKDGDRLLEAIGKALPLGDSRERMLFAKFSEVSRATIKGTFVVGLVQGFLGGMMFWILGINAAIFWGVIMTLLSFLPVLGSSIVWVPAVIILFATGYAVKGLILLIAGIFLIGLSDNILRPVLVGRETQLPDYLVLLSTLGGITIFGVTGIVIGPVIAALFLAVWDLFGQEFSYDETSSLPQSKELPNH
jgi:predicted PurR-regulated permease PerM